jgi:hypothetical protein
MLGFDTLISLDRFIMVRSIGKRSEMVAKPSRSTGTLVAPYGDRKKGYFLHDEERRA